jgi:2-iminobutanoate/2-iminopropanoate deaminase
MEKQIIQTEGAPAPIGPYNQAVRAGNMLFISGQIPMDPSTGELSPADDIRAATQKVMENLENILKAAGLDFSHVVKTSIFLMDMGQFAEVNEVYARYFTANFPARETVQVSGLPRGVRVEISMIAVA